MTLLTPPKDEVLKNMLQKLRDIVWPGASNYASNPAASASSSVPNPDVWVANLVEEAVGLGNRIGLERKHTFSLTALKGGRLNALVRFQVWGNDLNAADQAVQAVQKALLAGELTLRAQGFLKLQPEDTSLAEYVEPLSVWRKTVDYQILYEFYYDDTDSAEGLIARIPVYINGHHPETFVVFDEMVRWGSPLPATAGAVPGAPTTDAPPLAVQGSASQPVRVRAIARLAVLPDGWDGQGVTLEVLSAGGIVHQKGFDSLRDFLAVFTTDPKPIWLGGHPYLSGIWNFPNADFPDPIVLKGGSDLFRVRYGASALEHDAVVYLRVLT